MAAPAELVMTGGGRSLAAQQVNPPEKAETSKAHECGRLSQIALVRV
jgi:hypothetical protein